MRDHPDPPDRALPPQGSDDLGPRGEVREPGLDWGDVSLIRRQLDLTPTERLRSMQDLVNTALRIRNQNAT